MLLAALSAGSLAGGLVYGARTWPGACRARLAALMAGLAVAFALLALAGAQLVLAALLVARRPAARADHRGRLDAAGQRRAARHRDRGVRA